MRAIAVIKVFEPQNVHINSTLPTAEFNKQNARKNPFKKRIPFLL